MPGRGDSAARVEDHSRPVPAVRAPEHLSERGCVRLWVAAAQLFGIAALDAELERVELVLADGSTVDLADEVRPAGRELVDAARTVDDVRAGRLEPDERVGEGPRELGRVHAEHQSTRTCRVRQRPEHVEDGTRRKLAPDGGCVPHRGMVRLREEEAEAELVDRALDPLRGQL